MNLFLQKLPTMKRERRAYLALATKTSEDF
jgi:hypothetical protein